MSQIKSFPVLRRKTFSAAELGDRGHIEPRPVVGDLLRQAFHDDYTANLQFELIRLLLILSHVPAEEDAL